MALVLLHNNERVDVTAKINTQMCLGFKCYSIKIANEIRKVTLPVVAFEKTHFIGTTWMFYLKGESGEHWEFTYFSVSHEEAGQTATITVVTNPFLFLKRDGSDVGEKDIKKDILHLSKKKKGFLSNSRAHARTHMRVHTLGSSACPTFV